MGKAIEILESGKELPAKLDSASHPPGAHGLNGGAFDRLKG
jgi:hypothetical protein